MATFDRFREVPYPPHFNLSKQSFEVPDSRVSGYSGIYRNSGFDLLTYTSPLARKNLLQIFQSGLNISPNGRCLGHRRIVSVTPQVTYEPHFTWQTYREVDVRRRNIGSAFHFLRTNGRVGGGELPTAGIWSYNKPEYQIIDLAMQAYAGVSVSLYDSANLDTVEYICKHADISIIFLIHSHIRSLLSVAPKLKNLKVIVCIEEPLVHIDKSNTDLIELTRSWATQLGLEFYTLSEFETLGSKHLVEIIPADSEQIYSLTYTSGTTGDPKGVILTHGQCAMTVLGATYGRSFFSENVYLSFLPMAHCFDRAMQLITLNNGGSIGYLTAGDPTRIIEDMQTLQPTEIALVPRLFSRFYQSIIEKMGVDKSDIKAKLLMRAVNDKTTLMRSTGQLSHPIWDRLIFNKIKSVFGGRLGLISTGSAPNSPEILQFFRAALGCSISSGKYGLTETFGCVSHSPWDDFDADGSVGVVKPCLEARLKDVPEMGYFSSDRPCPRGEILCRGMNVITRDKGYYKDPKATTDAVDEMGWFHTGDVGEIDSCGRLRIIDRVKNLLKLSQGEYIGLEKVEGAYSSCSAVAQIYVHGDSSKDYLVAVIVPEISFLSKVGITPGAKDENINDPRVTNLLLSELNSHANKMELPGFEKIHRIYLTLEPFSIDNGMLTPTLKLRRRDAYAKYKHIFDNLYADDIKESAKM